MWYGYCVMDGIGKRRIRPNCTLRGCKTEPQNIKWYIPLPERISAPVWPCFQITVLLTFKN